MKLQKKQDLQQKRRWRIRKKISGTAERPRLTIHLSHKHAYAQAIDDEAGHTLVYLSSLSKEVADRQLRPNVAGATELGKLIADKCRDAGINRVVFDRGGRRYHGCIKAFADAAREGGLNF
ncbi:MAG: 50S ribosomal protein L18 [Opitutales bacterium]